MLKTNILALIAIAATFASCSSPQPLESPEKPVDSSQSNLKPQQITFCGGSTIDYPHRSTTIPSEADVKGRIACTPEFVNLSLGARVSLFYSASGSTFSLVNSRSYSSRVGVNGWYATGIAAALCKPGYYQGRLEIYATGSTQTYVPLFKESPAIYVSCK
jgi:hypothetical protein